MRVIVVFDIPVEHNKLRDELRELLKNYGGTFLEYSVYETELDERVVVELIEKVRRLLRRGAGRVDFVFPCERCYRKIIVVDTTQL
ncbi:MAG: CRISPR-associated endonuclease Cas2 [Thermoprotei archaeon]|nr:MAG: CRISPR-associated endonuclease Cas2 [Thermoprotei archaeon]